MEGVTRRDFALLALGVPLFLLVLSLHLTEATQRALAEPPLWAIATWGDDYPRVGGYRVGSARASTDLRKGDRLIRVGERDLRGHAYAGFTAIALAEAGEQGVVTVEYERDGSRATTTLAMVALENPYVRFPGFSLALVVAVIVLLRARDRPRARLFYFVWVATSIFELPFHGPREWQTYASVLTFTASGTIVFPAMWLSLSRFPGAEWRRSPVSARWFWLIGACFLLPRIGYSYGVPFDPEWLTRFIQGTDAVWMIGIVTLLGMNYRHGTMRTRRRMRWIVLGSSLGISHLLLSGLALALDPDGPWFVLQYGVAGLVPLMIPISILISIVRFNFLDVDRILSATATLGLLAAAFVVTLVTAIPFVADVVAGVVGISPVTAQVAFVLPVAGAIVPATRRLYPRVDALLFPARVDFQRGVSELLAEMSEAISEEGLVRLIERRLVGLFEPRQSALFLVDGDSIRRIDAGAEAHEATAVPSLNLLSRLEAEEEPWLVEGADGGDRRGELDPKSLAFSQALDIAILLPIRRPDGLCALICLGPRSNGDVYTRTDLALLSAVGHQAAATAAALVQADALVTMRRERASADEANRAKSQLIASASHDLRQPVHALGLLIGMLEETRDPEALDRVARRMRIAVESLQELLSSVLEVSKLDAGVIEPEVGVVSVGSLVERIGEEFTPLAAASGLEMRVVSSSAFVRSDAVLLTRIVRNLAMNAIRYTEEGGILLGCRVRGDQVRVQVWDTGPGIAEDRQQEIFEEYRQLEGARATAGLGLGLSIVARLCRLLGHEVDVRSRVGRGSVFEVRVERTEAPTQDAPVVSHHVGLEGRRVLVIDDDPAIRDASQTLLASWGCDVRVARDGDEAVACLKEGAWRPELALVDYRLEVETGLDVLERLEPLVADLRAAVISGEHESEIATRVAARGLPLIAKPLSAPRLRSLIGRMLPR